jgi:hypothetical protein
VEEAEIAGDPVFPPENGIGRYFAGYFVFYGKRKIARIAGWECCKLVNIDPKNKKTALKRSFSSRDRTLPSYIKIMLFYVSPYFIILYII